MTEWGVKPVRQILLKDCIINQKKHKLRFYGPEWNTNTKHSTRTITCSWRSGESDWPGCQWHTNVTLVVLVSRQRPNIGGYHRKHSNLNITLDKARGQLRTGLFNLLHLMKSRVKSDLFSNKLWNILQRWIKQKWIIYRRLYWYKPDCRNSLWFSNRSLTSMHL